MKVVLLAAGVGRRFGKKTKKLPKCLIPLGKNTGAESSSAPTLLSRYLDSFRALGLKKVVIVVGHEKEKIKKECLEKGAGLKIKFIFNKDYKKGSVVSLYTASKEFDGDCLIMDADVHFPTPALGRLLRSKHKTAFLIDTRSKSGGEEMMLMGRNGHPMFISKSVGAVRERPLRILGEATGFFKIQKKDAVILKRVLKDFVRRGQTSVEYEETYNVLMQKRRLGFEKIDGFFWTEMDFEEDLQKILKAGLSR